MKEAVLDVPVAATEPNASPAVEKSDCHGAAERGEDLIFSKWWRSFSSIWDRTTEATLIKRAMDGVDEGTRVVDVGCGDMALFAQGFLDLPPRYLGIEPNQHLLSEAKKQFPSAMLISSNGLPFHLKGHHADFILCCWVLHISDEIQCLLEECRRIGRGGSKLIITIPDLNSELYSEVQKLAWRMFPESQILSPNTVLGEHHARLFKGLAGCDYKVASFSGSVFLPREPADRIAPLSDFVQWLLPSGLPLGQLVRRARAYAKDLAAIPAVLQDKGLLIEANLP